MAVEQYSLVANDWLNLQAIINDLTQRVVGQEVHPTSDPTFADMTLTGDLTIAGDIDITGDLDVDGTVTLDGLTASRIVATGASKELVSLASPLIVGEGGTGLATITDHGILLGSGTSAVTPLGVASNGQIPIGSAGADPVLATLTGTTDHISVANGAGSITLNLDTNTQTLLGSFNGIFLEKLDFTISESGGTVTGTLEQADGGGDLTQRFSDGYTVLDCTPAKTIDLTAYVGTNAVPKEVFIYILQSAKTTIVASNVDWPLDPELEHIKIAHLVLKSAATTGTDGGALMNQNHNDYAFDATGEGHLQDIEHRLRQEPAQYHSGVALTLKNAAGAELTTTNSSTAVELVTAAGHIFQIHQHNFPAFDMYTVGTDKADIVNQPTDEGGAYETTVDLVSDVTHYVDGSAAGVAIGVNKYFNLVVWGVMNKSGEVSFLMINLPTGQYTTSANAVADVDGTSIYEIPSAFKGTGFLIARLTFRLIGGSQWTYIAQEDLRGKFPDIIAGVGITTTDHALLANLIAPANDHTQYILHSLADAANDFLVASGADTYVKKTLAETGAILEGDIVHDNLQSIPANDHVDHTGVTLTAGSGITGGGDISTNRSFDLDINSLSVATIAAGDFVPFWDITATATNKKITFANLEGTLSHDALADYASNEHFTQAAITTVGAIGAGTWEATDVAVAHGGTGASNAGDARTNLGLVIGTNVLAYDAGLQNLAGVAMAADRYYYTSGDNVHVAGTITAAGRAVLDDATAAAQATTLGLGTGDSPQFSNLTISQSLNGAVSGVVSNTNVGANAYAGFQFQTDGGSAYFYRTSDAYGFGIAGDLVFQEAGGGDMVFTLGGGTAIRIADTTRNVTMEGTLTVNGDQSGATDHVFDDYDDISLLEAWRQGDKLPFNTGDLLNRDRLLRDSIIQLNQRVCELENN